MLQEPVEAMVERAVGSLMTTPISEDGKLEQMVDNLSHAFKIQTAAVEVYLRGIEKILSPCLPLQFLNWVLLQRPKFYEDSTGLFHSLFRDEMGASSEQIKSLLEFKTIFQLSSSSQQGGIEIDKGDTKTTNNNGSNNCENNNINRNNNSNPNRDHAHNNTTNNHNNNTTNNHNNNTTNNHNKSSQSVSDESLMNSFIQFYQLVKQGGVMNRSDAYDHLREIFTAKQMASFFKWVHRFGGICIKINV